MIPDEAAIEAAKEAMREVTPPPGVSKADWLAEHGDFALIAGAIAAAAPHIKAEALHKAADDAEGFGHDGDPCPLDTSPRILLPGVWRLDIPRRLDPTSEGRSIRARAEIRYASR